MIEKYTTFDKEVLPNLYTVIFKDFKTGKKKYFVIHESRNDFVALMRFVKTLLDQGYVFIGYNCLGYDGQLMEYMIHNYNILKHLSAEEIAYKIYKKSQFIISLPDEEKYLTLLPEWKLSLRYLDLYKQQHYDAQNKRTSLKWLQFTMRFHNIQTMPVHHSQRVEEKDIPSILEYDDNDVESTEAFFKLIKYETDLRIYLSKKFDLHLLNASEPRIAREIFGKFMSEATGIPYRELKEGRTFRNTLYGKDLVFKYIKFDSPVLNAAKEFYQKLVFCPYDFKDNNYNLNKVEKVFKYHNLPKVVVGLGGIHACTRPGVYEPTKDWSILEIDGKSYYPNIGIKNKIFPQHLSSVFCVVNSDLYDMKEKLPKTDPCKYIYKIMLNAVYGQSKERNNYFHDPKYTFTVTINGQLLLLKLAEILLRYIPDIIFYQFNTDGVTIGYKTEDLPKVKQAMADWVKVTKIPLEETFLKKVVIEDVNSYMTVDESGKVKRRKNFAYSMKPEDTPEMQYHKSPNALIIPKALEAYFLHGKDYVETIMECKDIFDFCCGVKVKSDFDLIKHSYNEEEIKIDKDKVDERVVRYYISHETSALKKEYKMHSKRPGQSVELEKGYNMTYYNVHTPKPMKDYKINYKYYISECRKIVDKIHPNANQLKLL